MGQEMECLRQYIKIALVQSPAGIVNSHPLERCNGEPLDNSSPPSFDHCKQRGTQAKVGNAARLLRPAGEVRDLLKSQDLLPYLRRQGVKTAMFEQVARLKF